MGSKAGAHGNDEAIGRLLRELYDTFDLTRPGRNGSFAEDLLDEFSTSVYARTVGEGQTPTGSALEANRGEYGKRKEARGLPVGIGLEASSTDRMLSLVQLRGERSIEPELATAVYGVSEPARNKASWFSFGATGSGVQGEFSGAKGQPARPFWGFDDEMTARLVALCEARIEEMIRDLGG